MDLVIDASVLFSALIKNSIAYNLLFSGSFHLFTPEYIFTELENTKKRFSRKVKELLRNFSGLLKH